MGTKSNGNFKLNVGTGPSTEILKGRTQKPPFFEGRLEVEVAQYTFYLKFPIVDENPSAMAKLVDIPF